MSETTDAWICPTCGYVDFDTRETRCHGGMDSAPEHKPAIFVQAIKGERLRTSNGRFALATPLDRGEPTA